MSTEEVDVFQYHSGMLNKNKKHEEVATRCTPRTEAEDFLRFSLNATHISCNLFQERSKGTIWINHKRPSY